MKRRAAAIQSDSSQSSAPVSSRISRRFGLIRQTPRSSAALSGAPEVSSRNLAPSLCAIVGGARIEIVRHAGRQAAAADHEFRARRTRRQRVEAGAPFRFAQGQSRQHEAVLLRRAALRDGKVLARFGFHLDDAIRNAVVVEQTTQQLPGEAADRQDRLHVAAEALDHARDIDAAAAGIAARRRAAQLAHGHDPVDRGREVDRRIGRQGDDIGHARDSSVG